MAARKQKTAAPRRHSAEFKAKATERILAGKETLAAIAADLGVSPNTVFVWKKKASKPGKATPVTNGNGGSALTQLLREHSGEQGHTSWELALELRLVKAERDILKAELHKVLRGQG